MNGQGDRHYVVQNIFLRPPVFGVFGPVDMNFPQGHGVAADGDPGHHDRNYPIVEYVGPGAEVDVGIDQHIEQEDPLPGGSRWRSREDDEDDESSSKRFRWWDECAYSDRDSCTDSDVSSIISEDSDEDDIVGEEEEEEEDPCPGVSRKRERDEEDEDDRSTKKSRQ